MPATPHIKTVVANLEEQTRFYTGVLGQPPAFVNDATAVWITENPRLCFEISAGAADSRQFVRSGPA